jgi:hypothetical protein
VTNDAGDFVISTDYNAAKENLSTVSIVSLGLGTHNLAKSLSTALYADVYNIGNGALKNWIAHLDVTHDAMVKEQRLYFFYGGGIGYGGIKQDVPGNVIETISGGKSQKATSSSLFANAKIGVRVMYRSVAFSVTCSYDYLKYKSWSYDTKEGSNDLPSAILPYPVVDVSGVYASGAILYFFKH